VCMSKLIFLGWPQAIFNNLSLFHHTWLLGRASKCSQHVHKCRLIEKCVRIVWAWGNYAHL
jgi:hypothetical protein